MKKKYVFSSSEHGSKLVKKTLVYWAMSSSFHMISALWKRLSESRIESIQPITEPFMVGKPYEKGK